MSSEESEIPEGAAVLMEIPAELGINPLLLGVLHSMVFLSGSTEDIVHPGAGDEAIDFITRYLERLDGDELRRTLEDMDCLIRFAREEQWQQPLIEAFETIREICVGEDDEDEEQDGE